ncbi:MAG: hypothetical protein ABJG41_16945 [Cyclobacteriaceae bacterium]
MKIKEIRIESEDTGVIVGGTKFVNDNSDIDVIFEDGEQFSATAFTYENINWLKQKNIQTGEHLNGKYLWATGMFIVESLERTIIEYIIDDLIEQEEFKNVFRKVQQNKTVWIFNGAGGQLPSGVFEELEEAKNWINENLLTGTLTECPINIGVFDWAEQADLINMKPEKLDEKRNDPFFVGTFTTASMNHFHFENGQQE